MSGECTSPIKIMKENCFEIRYRTASYEELGDKEKEVINAACRATEKSYAPYSRFFVGAAVWLENDVIVSGSNQENAAYPSGICAERTALFYANNQYPDQPVRILAIAARSEEGFTEAPVTPCGACRQVMLETETRFGCPMRILLYGKKKILIIEGTGSLLPFSFGQDFLT